MAVRFYEDGYEHLDPMSGVTMAGGAYTYDDGTTPPPWLDRPGYGQNDLIASEQLRLMQIPREQLAATRPQQPQMLFPPRLGYIHDTLTIDDVLADVWAPQQRSYTSPPTIRRAFEEQMWEGSERNVSGTVNPMM